MGIGTGGKAGGRNALASRPNLLSALRVQNSAYGQVRSIVYGQSRIAGRLIWAGDFTAIPHTSTENLGGKGGGGGQTVSQTTYTYQTAVAIALCTGPIQNIQNVWDTKGRLTLLTASVNFTVPTGGGSLSITPPSSGIFHSDRGVTRPQFFSINANDFGSDGPVTLNGTQTVPMLQVSGAPAAGEYQLSGATYTFAAADGGLNLTIEYVYSIPDSNSNGQPQQKLDLTLFTGARPQTPWAYLSGAHPGQDLGYNGVAYVASPALDLGESGTLPNLSYEVLGILPFGGGITDAEPSAIVADLIGNPYYGSNATLPLGDLSQFRSFCVANGLFLSPVLDSQRPASDWLQEILDATNSAAVWSEGLLKVVPYGDTTAVGSGATYIPDTTPIYDLGAASLLAPVTVARPGVADVMNSVSVEFLNRANDYNVEIAEDKDEALIGLYGLRKAAPRQLHSVTTSDVAKKVVNTLRKRQTEIRSTYTLKLGWQFALLEPTDLVTVTVPELGCARRPLRVTAIREDESGVLEMDAEEFPWGTASPTLYPHQSAAGFVPQSNADPGSVNAPMLFEANDRLSRSGGYEIWMGVSGAGPDWGGCSVWVSADNAAYKQIGRVFGPARMGALSSALASAADPDTTHTLSVDLTRAWASWAPAPLPIATTSAPSAGWMASSSATRPPSSPRCTNTIWAHGCDAASLAVPFQHMQAARSFCDWTKPSLPGRPIPLWWERPSISSSPASTASTCRSRAWPTPPRTASASPAASATADT